MDSEVQLKPKVLYSAGQIFSIHRKIPSASTQSPLIDDVNSSHLETYGWGKIHLRMLNKPWFFLACTCWLIFGQALACNGLHNSVLSTVENRFGFSTTEIGLISTFYNVMAGLFSYFVGYFGHRHRPRTLALGGLSLAIGLFIMSTPHYIAPKYKAGITLETDTCVLQKNLTSKFSSCDRKAEHKYLYIFILGHCLNGLGQIPLYTLSFSHINDIPSSKQRNIYFGMLTLMGILGPAVGYFLASPILNIYVDITQPKGSKLTPNDPHWVGAWWIAYVIGTIILGSSVIPLLGFPSTFNGHRQKKTLIAKKSLRSSLKSLKTSTLRLLKSAPYLFVTLSYTAEGLVIGGFATFLPKFIQTQFHYTASEASVYTGSLFIPGAICGIFGGSYICKRFDLDGKSLLKISSMITFLCGTCILVVLVGCEGRDIAGLSNDKSTNVSISNRCNEKCNCLNKYKPICSSDKELTYFSPCHAGCFQNQFYKGLFHNCSCINTKTSSATEGRCSSRCNKFPLFAVGVFLFMFFSFLNTVPLLNATFKVIPTELSSFGLGFQQVFIRFLGSVPSPVIFGKLIDLSCKLWAQDECTGKSTKCLEYHNVKFRYNMLLLGVVGKSFTIILLYLAYRTFKNNSKRATDIDVAFKVGIENFEID